LALADEEVIDLWLAMAAVGTSQTSGDVGLKSAKWAKADIAQAVVTNRNL
jgi:hypothetical protein